jgi:hypothetical protein
VRWIVLLFISTVACGSVSCGGDSSTGSGGSGGTGATGGTGGTGGNAGAGGSAGTGNSAGTTADAASDAPVEAGPCEPVDHWALTYAPLEAGPSQTAETVVISEADAGGYELTWLDRTVPQDQCSPNPDGGSDAGSGPVTVSASFDAATCTLSATWNASWCQSGEQQCDTFDLSLTLSGATASGSAERAWGWCMQKQHASYAVSGIKTN